MSLDDVVDLSIDVNSLIVAKENFGTPLILGYHVAWVDVLVKEYATPKEMLDDGFSASHYLYKAMQAAKAQNPAPKTVKIGRRTTALTQILHVTPTITTEGKKLHWTIGATTSSYTILAGATIQTIVEALQPIWDGYAEVGVTEDNTKLVVTAAAAGAPVNFSFGAGFTVSEETSDTTTDDALAAIIAEDSDWYGLAVADSQSKATGLLAAATIEAERKMAVLQSADSATYNSGSSTDLFAALESAAYARTVALFHAPVAGTEWAAIAWLAKSIAKTPGKVTWAHKVLAGITRDTLTQAQQTALVNKNANHYTLLGAQGNTFPGITAAGEFADIIHFVDYLYSRIRLVTAANLQAPDKIPYTDSGADVLTGGVLSVLNQNVGKSGAPAGLAEDPAPTCTHPPVASVAAEVRGARHLPDVQFGAQLQGAIHTLAIAGTIQV